jgi:thiol-disulfide isomerase/thioredoxin
MLKLTDETIAQALQSGNFIVLCYTDWCELCPGVIEIFDEAEQEKELPFTFAGFNYEECPGAVEFFKAPGMPAVFAVKDGDILDTKIGLRGKDAYRAMIPCAFGDGA